MEPYTKVNRGYFPDFCDQRVYGISSLGTPFEVLTPNIVHNTMSWEDRLDGFKNPTWLWKVAHNVDATTPMTASRISVKANKCFIAVTNRNVSGYQGNSSCTEWKGYPLYAVPNTSIVPGDVLDRVRNHAIRKLTQHCAEARSSILGGQDLGEWKETVKAITNPLGALREYVLNHIAVSKKRLRRLRKVQKKYLSQVLADTYLEFTFGWIPLASDVGAGIGGLITRYNNPEVKVVTGSGHEYFSGTATLVNLFQKDYYQVSQTRQSFSRYDHRYKVCIKTGVSENGTRSRVQTLGFLPESFVPTVWELIPYSFVVDYFVNVGDIIEAHSFWESNLLWGLQTTRTHSIYEYSVPYGYFEPYPGNYYPAIKQLVSAEMYGGDATIWRRSVDRSSMTTFPIPRLEFHLPIKDKPWVNMGAILFNAMSRDRRLKA